MLFNTVLETEKWINMNCDQSFFRSINNELAAYWLGFIAADGCVSSYRNTLQIKLSLVDADHLDSFRKDIRSQREVKRYAKYAQIRIDNRFLHLDLNNRGIVPRKSFVLEWDKTTHDMEDEYIWHFVRGYFDGDGCWGTKGRNSRYRNSVVFTITSVSSNFVDGLVKFMNQQGVNVKLYSSRDHVFRAQTCNLENCRTLYHFMYDNASSYLDRKKNKAIELFGDNL